jgi:divalent metal cation (Fe/Co/Zn/Cd) transporter
VFIGALGEIMDERLPPDEERLIEQCLDDHRETGVRGYHHLRTRKAGRQRYVDLHMLVDPEQTVEAAHDVCDALEEAIRARLPGVVVTIHLEPDDGRYRGPWHQERMEMGGEDGEARPAD